MSFTARARPQGGVTSPAMARATAVAAEINRAQATAPAAPATGPVTRAPKKGDGKNDPQPKIDPLLDDDKDDDKPPKKKKSEADDEGFVELQSAGTASDGKPANAGTFTPMPGSLDSAFDDNDSKGETPAKNDTGKPKTPSGI